MADVKLTKVEPGWPPKKQGWKKWQQAMGIEADDKAGDQTLGQAWELRWAHLATCAELARVTKQREFWIWFGAIAAVVAAVGWAP